MRSHALTFRNFRQIMSMSIDHVYSHPLSMSKNLFLVNKTYKAITWIMLESTSMLKKDTAVFAFMNIPNSNDLLRCLFLVFCNSTTGWLPPKPHWCCGGSWRTSHFGVSASSRTSWAHYLLEKGQNPHWWQGWEDQCKYHWNGHLKITLNNTFTNEMSHQYEGRGLHLTDYCGSVPLFL